MAIVALIVSITLGLMVFGGAVSARHRAQAAADLAALAGAARLAEGVTAACATAAALAQANHARVTACDVSGLDVVVEVAVPVDLGRWGLGTAAAIARAGPGEPV